jgi:catechol 2,3-dioxygenase-like lactoylglutathione lyase family enzyme
MKSPIADAPANFHISLNVSNLARSVDFYQKLFGTPPAKSRPDYAKFESTNPPLTLSLEPAASPPGGPLNHVGFRLADSSELVELQRRLEMAGLPSQREAGVECCYARQTKFWLRDPDGVLWEFYVLEEDIAHRGAGQDAERVLTEARKPQAPMPAATAAGGGSALPPPLTDWEHRLGEEVPTALPFEKESLAEVRLRGTFNAPLGGTQRSALFAEIARVLIPGGRVVLHQLTADRPLEGTPALPGPASAVREVPVDEELLAWIEDAGFQRIRLVKLGAGACFTSDGVEMRETIIEACKAPVDSAPAQTVVVFRGPFRAVVDDGDRLFRRGQRVAVTEEEWAALEAGPFADSFVRLTTATPTCSADGSYELQPTNRQAVERIKP